MFGSWGRARRQSRGSQEPERDQSIAQRGLPVEYGCYNVSNTSGVWWEKSGTWHGAERCLWADAVCALETRLIMYLCAVQSTGATN
jgi:hypothetical protein